MNPPKARRPDPATLDEYNLRQSAGAVVGGHGPETHMTVPCPFCCEPNFQTWYIWPGHPQHLHAVATKEQVCRNCERGVLHIFESAPDGTVTKFEIVQTRGDDPPPYFPPMRRVSIPEGPKQ